MIKEPFKYILAKVHLRLLGSRNGIVKSDLESIAYELMDDCCLIATVVVLSTCFGCIGGRALIP